MDALGINLPGLITQIVSFIILFAVLYVLLYKPVLQMLDRRSNSIKESLDLAQKTKDDAAKNQEEMQQQIEQARNDGQAMIAQAREVADRFREEELAKARQEIESEREKARQDIQRERDAAVEELRSEFSGLAITAAEKIVNSSIDESSHSNLIEEVLNQSSKIGQK